METRFTPLWHLRLAAMAESATLLVLLFIAVPLKHTGGQPGLVTVMGPLHGLAFLYYLWNVASTVSSLRWSRAELWQLLGFSVLPFGAWFAVRVIRRHAASMDETTK